VLRALPTIVSAILLSRPELPRDTAERWATVLQREAQARDFDPLSVVAIVHFESGWHPEVVSPNGEDYGLGQVRARYIGACKGEANAKDAPSAACQAEKQALLDAEHNLVTIASLIEQHRKLCRAKAGNASFPRWLASYQGRNYPRQHRWCAPGDGTWKVVRYQQWLAREVARPGGPAAATAPPTNRPTARDRRSSKPRTSR
jgi:hypothetical protein